MGFTNNLVFVQVLYSYYFYGDGFNNDITPNCLGGHERQYLLRSTSFLFTVSVQCILLII